ncbi:MAG: glutamate--cysteine ligase, partial [Proteobacteria bacterium SW_6_67_9]
MAESSALASRVVHDKRDLVAYLESGCKPPQAWRIGTEHEKFVFRWRDHTPVSFEGPDGIGAFLEGLTRFGWEPIYEHGQPIALKRDEAAITLELIGLGFHPSASRDEMPWMPKQRYRIMGRYMPTRGDLGLDMMTRSCGVQVNLDFSDETDMVRKYRVSLALQPIATALFAHSPFAQGRPNGHLSYRAHIWHDTDPDRCGIPGFVFEDGMGFERYTEYALDVPMYFVVRDGELVDCAGQSFRDFLAGRLPALPGERPTLADWEDHLTTLFPEVRIKRFMEQRGADAGPWRRLCALPALWVGLLYDETALAAAEDLVRGWSAAEVAGLQQRAGRAGLNARHRGHSLADWAD